MFHPKINHLLVLALAKIPNVLALGSRSDLRNWRTIAVASGVTTHSSAASGTPDKIEQGCNPTILLSRRLRSSTACWNLRKRKHEQVIDLGWNIRWFLNCAHHTDPNRTYGFVGVVISLKDLSASIWYGIGTAENGERKRLLKFRQNQRSQICCPRFCKDSRQFLHWSPISIYHWMTNGSMFLAGNGRAAPFDDSQSQ